MKLTAIEREVHMKTGTTHKRRTVYITRGEKRYRILRGKNTYTSIKKEPTGDVVNEIAADRQHIKNIIDLGYAYRPELWDLPKETIKGIMRTRKHLTESMRTRFKTIRDRYIIHDVPLLDLTEEQIDGLCKTSIAMEYIKYAVNNKKNKILIASRNIEPCIPPKCFYTSTKTCVRPDVLNIFRKIKPAMTYEEFVASIPKTADRNKMLCDLLPRKEHTGAFCIYEEKDDQITVWIICSNRALGKRLLDHLVARKKTIVIDTPLTEVVSFYENLGWEWIRNENGVRKNAMIRHPI